MRYTVIIMKKESYEYRNTNSDTFNFNPEYNKLTSVTGRTDSYMLDLVKQKDGVYLLTSSTPLHKTNLFLLLPESHPLFNAACIEYIDLKSVYLRKIKAFQKKASEGIVRELLNN